MKCNRGEGRKKKRIGERKGEEKRGGMKEIRGGKGGRGEEEKVN